MKCPKFRHNQMCMANRGNTTKIVIQISLAMEFELPVSQRWGSSDYTSQIISTSLTINN